jgi:hypothetical protein
VQLTQALSNLGEEHDRLHAELAEARGHAARAEKHAAWAGEQIAALVETEAAKIAEIGRKEAELEVLNARSLELSLKSLGDELGHTLVERTAAELRVEQLADASVVARIRDPRASSSSCRCGSRTGARPLLSFSTSRRHLWPRGAIWSKCRGPVAMVRSANGRAASL